MSGLLDWVLGRSDVAAQEAPKSPREIFFEISEEFARREHLPFHVAMTRARLERPAEFLAAFPHQSPAPHVSGSAGEQKVVAMGVATRLRACDGLALAA